MTVQEAIAKNRSYRRFYQEEQISTEDLRTIVNAARLSPSGKNVQPLKYYICNEIAMNEEIFQTLGWAGYLTEWPGPEPGERPSAYIIQILDKNIAPGYICDDGITAQSMMLQAVELGYGGCIIATVKREKLGQIISLPENMHIIQVLALGKPKEVVVIDDMVDGDYKYWREEDGTHHVPKRTLDEIILK
ncbi:MAG: nitroreductase family protein [Bacteroidales bacterium]|nr:nitroreductase family protein [Bacteroidales bacterium]